MALQIRHTSIPQARLVTTLILALVVSLQPLYAQLTTHIAHAKTITDKVVINEVDPFDGQVELFNGTATDVTMVNWRLDASVPSTGAVGKTVTVNATILPGGYTVIKLANINNTVGDHIRLIRADNTEDNVVIGTMAGQQSNVAQPIAPYTVQRDGDGVAQWVVAPSTMNAANLNTHPSAPTMNAMALYYKVAPIRASWSVPQSTLPIKKYEVWYVYDDSDLHSFSGNTCPQEGKGGCRFVDGAQTHPYRDHAPGPNEQGGVTVRVRAINSVDATSNWSAPVHYVYDATVPEAAVTPIGTIGGNQLAVRGFVTDKNFDHYTCSVMVQATASPLKAGDSPADAAPPTQSTKESMCDTTAGVHSTVMGVGESSASALLGTVNISHMSSGDYTLRLIAYDKAGNTKTITANFVIDHTAPVLGRAMLSTPSPRESTPFTISGSVSGLGDTGVVMIRMHGAPDRRATVASDGSWTYSFKEGLSVGSNYQLLVVARDSYDNVSTPSPEAGTVLQFRVISGLSLADKDNAKQELQRAMTSLSQPFAEVAVAPLAVSSRQRLTGSDVASTPTPDASAVLGANTTKQSAASQAPVQVATIAQTKDGWRLFGLAWYWWVVILGGLAGLWYLSMAMLRPRPDGIL